MADFLEDVGVGYYRSLDPPKNFVVKVNLRRVTAASYLPEFKFGSQHNVNDQEGAEVAGEALEMQGLRQNQGKPPDQDSEESMFYWQQKMFSQREMELYGDLTNCFGPLEQKYHAEILKLRKKGGRPNRRLFSYVDCDSYVNVDEESRPLTTSPTEVPSYLTKNMTTVRRRNIGTRVDRRNKPGGFITRTDPIVVHETETSKTTAHVVNIPYKTMHVMADLAPEGKAEIDQNDEYVLFSIKIDANGQIFVKPDFNGEKPPYRIETQNDLREVYEYTIEHCSVQMTSDQREQEFKSFNELYNRHALYLASQVGSGFETMPEPGVLRMNILGEIVSAKGFDYDGLYVHFFLDLPEKWRPTDDPVLSGVTQTCMTKLEGEDYVAHFSFPFDFSLIYQEDDDCDDFIHWPTLFLEVLSLDSWERFRAEGYAYITIPSKAGSYSMEVNTWRPIGNGTGPEMRRFFIGGSPELEDPTYPQKPAMADDKVLSKYFFSTAGSGSVNVKFHVMQQCQSFMDSKAKKTRRTRTILDRLGGMNALDSLAQVMDAFQRAKKRMLDAREGLPSVK